MSRVIHCEDGRTLIVDGPSAGDSAITLATIYPDPNWLGPVAMTHAQAAELANALLARIGAFAEQEKPARGGGRRRTAGGMRRRT